MKKIILLALGIVFNLQALKSQTDYVLLLTNDTIRITVMSWNNSRVYCEVDGKKIKYKSKEIIEFKAGDDYYETAKICATLIGFKRKMFLQRVLTGKINLYGIGVTDHFSSSNTVGSTTIKEHKSVSVTVGFVRKTSDPNKKYKKFADGVSKWDYPYASQIDYYNQNCN